LEIQFNLNNVYHEAALQVTIKDETEQKITKIVSFQKLVAGFILTGVRLS
jgi:hypothetical protein